MKMRTRTRVALAVAATAAVAVPSTAFASGVFTPKPTEAHSFVSGDEALLADGVAIGKNAAWYKSSGLGPAAMNDDPDATAEERFIPTDVFPGGKLPEGVTLTEAQAIGTLNRIGDNLERAGLSYEDVISMRVFLQNPEGAEKMDYSGFNRAYRQFFANTNRSTGDSLEVLLGSTPTEPMVSNDVRPSRFALEIENLPVDGWLVEIEVDAVYPG
ncbi:Rid family hydrolase [Microbacterium sp. G2-8]|uniref:Rid family hydrolase n=1 Tax=Microbacterium sp. G2-8 TaxID=2842454 RepID=UPI0021AA211F|nr:Rid family hydrolase [Microbacterium sp. G2-8]